MKVISDDRETEAVDRRNSGMMNQGCLPLQVNIFRLLLQLLFDGSPDPLFHLCRRRLSKRYNQKLIYVKWIFSLNQSGDDPLH